VAAEVPHPAATVGREGVESQRSRDDKTATNATLASNDRVRAKLPFDDDTDLFDAS